MNGFDYAFGADAEGVEKNGGGTGPGDSRHRQLLQQNLFTGVLSNDGGHRIAETALERRSRNEQNRYQMPYCVTGGQAYKIEIRPNIHLTGLAKEPKT